MISLYARLAAIASLLVALAGGGWWCYVQGKKTVLAEWTAEKLAISENARMREKALNLATERVDRDYQITKKRLADDKRINDDRLREFTAAATSPDPDTAATCGDYGDPRPDILAECVGTLVVLDEAAKRMASQTAALQRYIREVLLADQ